MLVVPRSFCRLALGAGAVAVAAGCDTWPLHAALPDPVPRVTVPVDEESVEEDLGVAEGALQDLGLRAGPLRITVRGDAAACGWDQDALWPVWPDHPEDDDGDGVVDRTGPRHRGWFGGDVDAYGLSLGAPATVTALLSWERAPATGQNAPYQPGVPGQWADESDLDVLLFARDGDALGDVLAEAGFSRSHPESTGAPRIAEEGETIAVVVGCHHAVGSAYTLTIELAPR
jgi:hypothetical protein